MHNIPTLQAITDFLDEKKIEYTVRRHDAFDTPIKNPNDFARALGYDVSRITKTLLMESDKGDGYLIMAVCPIDRRIDLSKLAKENGVGRLQLASKVVLQDRVGHPPTGVSPIGVKNIRICIDQRVLSNPTVLVGAGGIGVEIEIDPNDLKVVTNASISDFAN